MPSPLCETTQQHCWLSITSRKSALSPGDRSQPVLNFGCQAFPPTPNRTSAHAAQSICIEPTLRSQLSRFRLTADEPIKPCHSKVSLRPGVSACAIDTSMVATALLIAASDGRTTYVRAVACAKRPPPAGKSSANIRRRFLSAGSW